MADRSMDERKLTDREVREILKRAVERAPSRALAKSEGLSLAELKSIGAEVGIDPARLEDAARKVVLGGGNLRGRLIGGPTILHFERKVAGEYDPKDTPEVLSIVRRTVGHQGEVDEIHGTLEWRAKGDSGERSVTLSSRDGITTIRSWASLSNAAILTYVPAGILGLMTSFVGLIKWGKTGSEIGLVVFFTLLPVLYLILRTIFGQISRSVAARLEQVVDELARMTEKD